jgi:hypothetical protein
MLSANRKTTPSGPYTLTFGVPLIVRVFPIA